MRDSALVGTIYSNSLPIKACASPRSERVRQISTHHLHTCAALDDIALLVPMEEEVRREYHVTQPALASEGSVKPPLLVQQVTFASVTQGSTSTEMFGTRYSF